MNSGNYLYTPKVLFNTPKKYPEIIRLDLIRLALATSTKFEFSQVEVHRNNLQFCRNEKLSTKMTEGKLKLLAEKLQFACSLKFKRFVLAILMSANNHCEWSAEESASELICLVS